MTGSEHDKPDVGRTPGVVTEGERRNGNSHF